MRELPLDRVGVPFAPLVEKGRGHRPEAMRRHLVARVAEASQALVHGIF